MAREMLGYYALPAESIGVIYVQFWSSLSSPAPLLFMCTLTSPHPFILCWQNWRGSISVEQGSKMKLLHTEQLITWRYSQGWAVCWLSFPQGWQDPEHNSSSSWLFSGVSDTENRKTCSAVQCRENLACPGDLQTDSAAGGRFLSAFSLA